MTPSVRVQEHARRVHASTQSEKVLKPRVELGELVLRLVVRFRPVRLAAVRAKDLLKLAEQLAVGHIEVERSVTDYMSAKATRANAELLTCIVRYRYSTCADHM